MAASRLAKSELGWNLGNIELGGLLKAKHWMRMQASYALAQARRTRATPSYEAGSGVA